MILKILLTKILIALGVRTHIPKLINFTEEELDAMWEDDTIDVKNFSRMDEGQDKNAFRKMLKDRMYWYETQHLNDWADQIDVALWIDEKNAR